MQYTSLPIKLRVLRAERQLSLREASAQTGVDKVALSRYERGLGRPQDLTLSKIAKGYGVPVEELLEEPVPLAEAPEAGYAAPEALEPFSPRVREWLQAHDAIFGAMSDEEFENHVLQMDLKIDSEGRPQAILRLIEQLDQEDDATRKALNQEPIQGGALLPKVEKGPGFAKRFLEQGKEKTRLKEKIHRRYSARQSALYSYSAQLYDDGETGDYLLPASVAEGERRRLLQEAFTEAGAA